MLGRRDLFFSCPLYLYWSSHAKITKLLSILLPLFLPSSSVSLSYFIRAVPMRECLGKHSCASVWGNTVARVFGETLLRECLWKHSCASVWENTLGRVFGKTLLRECLGKHSCASVWENTLARLFGKTLLHECYISYILTEWYLIVFFRQWSYKCIKRIRWIRCDMVETHFFPI